MLEQIVVHRHHYNKKFYPMSFSLVVLVLEWQEVEPLQQN
jgi:hypothetical protein